MSRAGIPLHPSDDGDAGSKTLGMFAIEGGYRADGSPDASPHRRLVLVLDFDTDSRQSTLGHALHGLAREVVQRYQAVPLAHAQRLVPIFLEPHPGRAVAIVVRLPADSAQHFHAIDALTTALATDSRFGVDLIVAVADTPAAWAQLHAVRHFIATGRSGSVRATTSAARLAASLMASWSVLEADAPELMKFLGPASAPAYLFHGTWSASTSTFALHPDWSVATLAHASTFFVLNEGGDGGGRVARGLLRQWRALCPNVEEFVGNVTHGFFGPAGRGDDEQPVLAVCRFDGQGSPFADGTAVPR